MTDRKNTSKFFSFSTKHSTKTPQYTADLRDSKPVIKEVGGSFTSTSYSAERIRQYITKGEWIFVEDLEAHAVGELVDGVFRAATLDDIKDFQRVETKDGIFVVFVNARDADLTKFITNGKDKPTKLALEDVLAVYSQPAGTEVLNPAAKGKLRYKQIDATEVETLKAQITLAEKALAAAKAKLAAI